MLDGPEHQNLCSFLNSRSLSFAYLKGHLHFQINTVSDDVTGSQVAYFFKNLNLGSVYVLQNFQVSGVDFLLIFA